jgi:hypothetical protein
MSTVFSLIAGPTDTERIPNKEVSGIIQELENIAEAQPSDAFILYLYLHYNDSHTRLGATRIRDHKADDAFQPLLQSIQQCPYIWSTWQELSSIITSTKTVSLFDLGNKSSIQSGHPFHTITS